MKHTQDLYEALQKKMQLGDAVNWRDLAVRIGHEEMALFDYMCTNDLIQVWALLHASDAPFFIGKNADFMPDKKLAMGELDQLRIRKDFKDLNDIIQAFRINMGTKNFTTNPEFIRQMENISLITMNSDGKYSFKPVLS